jgi:hypothetical protein
VLLGHGDGTFGAHVDYATGTNAYSVAIADLNGDGKLDLAVSNYDPSPSRVSVLLGDGHGAFGAHADFTVGLGTKGIASGDLNGDGKRDLVAANYTSSNISVLIGDGLGGFGTHVDFAAFGNPFCVALGDLDGDGRLDAVVVTSFGGIDVFRGDGMGGFGPPTFFQGLSGSLTGDVILADVNRDGKLDVVVGHGPGNQVAVYLGDGHGSFGAPSYFATGTNPMSVAVGDVNGDGKLDVATANFSTSNTPGTVSVLLGNGLGGFGPHVDITVGISARAVAMGDVNGDGRLDLVVANAGSQTVSVLLGDGNGSFSQRADFGVGKYPVVVAVADLNGDGRGEIASGSQNGGYVAILGNQGTGAPFFSYCYGGDSVASHCPCGNDGLAGHGCDNSASTGGAILSASGNTSPDSVVLASSNELPSVLSIFLQGDATILPASFGDGLRCAGGHLRRLYVHNASAGSVSAPQGSDPSITARSAALGDPIARGSTRFYQVYYRDPVLTFCPSPPGDSWNVSNAIAITW